MKLNSNTAFNLLGIVFMVAFIGALMLAGAAGLSTAGIIITGAVVAVVGNFAAIMLLAKYGKEQQETTGGFNVNELSVPRTVMSTSIEIIIGVLVAIAWAVSVRNGLFTDDDGSFNFRTLIGMILSTCTVILMLWGTYSPGDMNNAGKLTNFKQVKLAVGMNRLFAVLFAIVMLVYSFPALQHLNWLWTGLAAILLIVFITFRLLIRRARD